MSHRNYLLIIDDTPVDEDLRYYFAQFNLDIVQQQTLYPIDIEQGMPAAILIHWSILKNEPQAINEFCNVYPTPLLIINNSIDEGACITVLENGADDFIIKPLYPRELHARITAITRRIIRVQQNTAQGKDVLVFANWRLNPASRQVFDKNNQELQLSAGEYDLLFIFVQQPQRILDRDLLLQITKNTGHGPFDRRIDVQISRLRQKIEINAKKPTLIKTIRNGGYMFTSCVVTLKEKN